MLEAVVLALLISVVVVTVAFAALIGVFSYQLGRSNRVSPDTATLAPIVWLWSPSQQARLHRRLRGAVRPIAPPTGRSRARAEQPPHVELMRTVAAQAVAVDQQVVHASRLSRQHRRHHLRAITPQVVEVERLSLRLLHQQRLAARPVDIGGSHPVAAAPAAVLEQVSQRLDQLEEAHDELVAIERQNGLADPDELLARLAQTRPEPAPRVGRPVPAPRGLSAPGTPPPAPRRPGP